MYNSCSIISVLKRTPHAIAQINGSQDYPRINGTVKLYQTGFGVIVFAEVNGLTENKSNCGEVGNIFAFHIHEGCQCSGNIDDPFANAKKHYNPNDCPHPYHAGDLPPLFSNNGYALSIFLTNRFCVKEVLNKTIIIHNQPDDFTTQPSGNAGTKIACGVIRACSHR